MTTALHLPRQELTEDASLGGQSLSGESLVDLAMAIGVNIE